MDDVIMPARTGKKPVSHTTTPDPAVTPDVLPGTPAPVVVPQATLRLPHPSGAYVELTVRYHGTQPGFQLDAWEVWSTIQAAQTALHNEAIVKLNEVQQSEQTLLARAMQQVPGGSKVQ